MSQGLHLGHDVVFVMLEPRIGISKCVDSMAWIDLHVSPEYGDDHEENDTDQEPGGRLFLLRSITLALLLKILFANAW